MENSSRFFQNDKCQYFPCHDTGLPFNCLFCYCPLYRYANCGGTYKMIDVKGKTVKDCMNCTFPHDPENYDQIIDLLSNGELYET